MPKWQSAISFKNIAPMLPIFDKSRDFIILYPSYCNIMFFRQLCQGGSSTGCSGKIKSAPPLFKSFAYAVGTCQIYFHKDIITFMMQILIYS